MANKRINDLPNEATPAATDRMAIDGTTTRSAQLGAALAAILSGDDATARDELGLEIGSDVQAFSSALTALAALATNGHIVRTGAATYAARTITGTASQISVTNGDGVSGNPTIALINTAVTPGSYTNASITVDAQGRVTAASSGGVGVPGKTLIQVDVLTAGSGTWNRPTGATNAEVFVWGSGGSGASAAATVASQGSCGSGGGGGGFAYEYIALPNATESYTVGAGGAAPSAGANNGNNGNSSSFGTSPYLSATGGSGGIATVSTANNFNPGGAGGTGSGGSMNAAGGEGSYAYVSTGTNAGIRVPGKGGPSPGGGSGGLAVIGGTSGAGGAGNGPGAGGGGALSWNGGASAAGGAGADGLIIVKSYG